MKFPITPFATALNLYKIISVPHPTNQTNSKHATQIINIPQYFAITPDHRHFVTLEADILNTCEIGTFITCSTTLPVKEDQSQDCSYALFHDKRESIFEHCNFQFLTENVNSNIHELTSTSVLLSNIPQFTITCPNQTTTFQGCAFCIQHIPCLCSIRTNTLTYPPRIINCYERIEHT